MKISYKKLWVMLIEREIPKSTLRKDIELSPGTMSKLNKNEDVALSVLLRICDYLIVTLEIYVKLCERARSRSEFSCGYFVIGREKYLSERSIYGCP